MKIPPPPHPSFCHFSPFLLPTFHFLLFVTFSCLHLHPHFRTRPYLLISSFSSPSLHLLKFVTSFPPPRFRYLLLSSPPLPHAPPSPRFLLHLPHLLFRRLLLHLPLVPFLLPPPRKRVTERGGRLPRAWWRGVTRD